MSLSAAFKKSLQSFETAPTSMPYKQNTYKMLNHSDVIKISKKFYSNEDLQAEEGTDPKKIKFTQKLL